MLIAPADMQGSVNSGGAEESLQLPKGPQVNAGGEQQEQQDLGKINHTAELVHRACACLQVSQALDLDEMSQDASKCSMGAGVTGRAFANNSLAEDWLDMQLVCSV